MKQVTVIEVKPHDIMVYDGQDYLEVLKYSPVQNLKYVGNTSEFYEETIETESMPIRLYKFSNGKQLYAAIPKDLLDILDIEVDATEKIRSTLHSLKLSCIEKEHIKNELDSLKHKIGGMSFWNRLKFLFTGKMDE